MKSHEGTPAGIALSALGISAIIVLVLLAPFSPMTKVPPPVKATATSSVSPSGSTTGSSKAAAAPGASSATTPATTAASPATTATSPATAAASAAPGAARATGSPAPVGRETRWRNEALTGYLNAWKAGDCAASRVLASDRFGLDTGEMCGTVDLLDFTVADQIVTRPDGRVSTLVTEQTEGSGTSSDIEPTGRWYTQVRKPGGHWVVDEAGSTP